MNHNTYTTSDLVTNKSICRNLLKNISGYDVRNGIITERGRQCTYERIATLWVSRVTSVT